MFQNAVREKKSQVENCKKVYGTKAAEKKAVDAKATEAKKVLLTCSIVYYRAKLDANAEKHRMNARLSIRKVLRSIVVQTWLKPWANTH